MNPIHPLHPCRPLRSRPALRCACAAAFLAGLLFVSAEAQAQSPAGPPPPQATPAAHADALPLSDGEITRWDPRTLRVTLRHGAIQNLEMPPMTMVFRVADASVLGSLQPGDKVRFRAEQVSGAYHVTRIEKAP